MNVLFTVQTYFPLKDGVSIVTQYLAEGLAAEGHNVTVVTSIHDLPEAPAIEKHNGVSINRCDLWTSMGFSRGNKSEYKNLIAGMIECVDILINVCTQQAFTDVLLPYLEEFQCKKVLYMHGRAPQKPCLLLGQSAAENIKEALKSVRWNAYYAAEKSHFRCYDKVIQLHELDEATVYFRDSLNIHSSVIENAADDSFFHRCHFDSENRYVLQVANYMDRKNQTSLIEAFYAANIKDLALVLIGSDRNEYFNQLLKLKASLDAKYGVKDVRILAGVKREDTVAYIKKAYINLSMSKWEAFPISIIESVAAGVPYISSDTGVVRFIPGGMLANNRDEMIYLLKLLNDDPELRNSLSKVCIDYSDRHFKKTKKVKQLSLILEGLLG